MKCQRCNREITADTSFAHLGQILCDDCYMDARSPNKACDPWAVYSATRTRETSGLSGLAGLTSLQRDIYSFIKDNGRVTPEDVKSRFKLSPRDLENQFATLRHCELVKGQKDGNRVFIVPFS